MAVSAPAQPGKKTGLLSRFSDMLMAGVILTIVGMLIVPLPDWLLDLCIAINLATAVVVVMVTLYTAEPLEFSVFPSLLLVMTLFRLALNIAATKLILATGEPGHIIQAFGSVVLGNNFVVGVIAFSILVVVQFVVITNGAGRVAEVAARFTLDAMPGKQMSIDADLSAGNITEEEARERRKKIEAEADFYGAMDGASKFVRGDAIAAVLIIVINIVGGFAIGLVNGQSDALTILRTYTLLTVGEGLVSQIPALLISVATGLIVTRAASEGNMGNAFFGQIFARSTPMVLAAGLMLALFLVPGFPKLPLLLVGGALGFMAFKMRQAEKQQGQVKEEEEANAARAAQKTPEDPMRLLNVDSLLLELGSNLVPLALPDEGGDLAHRVGGARKQIATELGIILPMVRIRDNLQLRAHQYVIKIRDQVIAQHEIYPDQILAIDTGTVLTPVEGHRTTEPAFGLPAVWITRAMRERADLSGYHLALPPEVIITHLTEVIKNHAHELLTRQDVQALVEHARQSDKVVVEELIPTLMTLGEVQKVLQNLLRERVCVRDLTSVLETLADWAPRTKDLDQLTEYVRAALARQICKQHADDGGALNVLTLDPLLEQQLRESIQMTPTGVSLAIDHTRASGLISSLKAQTELASQEGFSPILLCSSQIRLAVKRITERSLPTLTVLAYNEVVPQMEVNAVGNVSLDDDRLTVNGALSAVVGRRPAAVNSEVAA
jgi:flagellar biosynthesis protein FlhA